MATTLILIHSPLTGPLTWQATAVCLRGDGCRIVVPSLAGAVSEGPPYYRNLARAVADAIEAEEPSGAVALIAHSGAGALLPAILEACRAPIACAVFADAILPHPGASWMDTAPRPLHDKLDQMSDGGMLPSWNNWLPAEALAVLLPDVEMRRQFVGELREIPRAYLEERAPQTVGWPPARCAFLQLSAAYAREAGDAAAMGWPVRRESIDHLAMLTQPERIASALRHLLRGPTASA
jgi:Alpha/beta hydrolase family